MDPMGMVNVSLSNLWSLAVMTCESHWTTGNLAMAVGCSWHGIRPLTCAECSHVCFCLLRSVPAPAVPGVLWKLMSCWRCWLDGNSMWRGWQLVAGDQHDDVDGLCMVLSHCCLMQYDAFCWHLRSVGKASPLRHEPSCLPCRFLQQRITKNCSALFSFLDNARNKLHTAIYSSSEAVYHTLRWSKMI